jgi:hypothetical protein
MEYTLPQIEDLVKSANKYIQFEVDVMQMPMKAMFGGGGSAPEGEDSPSSISADEDYQELSEESLGDLTRFLGGGL